MRANRLLTLGLSLASVAAAGLVCFPGPEPEPATFVEIPGLENPVRVIVDRFGIPHVFGETDLDVSRVVGWVHARDRMWQMDLTRREVSGDLAELLGPGQLSGDVQNRTIGLRRAAERTFAALTPREIELAEAYSAGVNAWLDQAEATGTLPPEYAEVEIGTVRRWNTVDSLAIGKGIAASLSLDIDSGTDELDDYIAAGAAATPSFEGEALYFEDVRRSAPMDPAAVVPDADGSQPFLTARVGDRAFLARAAAAAGAFRERAESSRLLAMAMNRRESEVGSNHWGVAGSKSATGFPIMANDPHLALDTPSTFYEMHVVVANDPIDGPMNVHGIGFAGVPFVILGQNEHITWGATTNPMDVTDLFLDTLVLDPGCGLCLDSEGTLHPVTIGFESYKVNQPDDGVTDSVVDAGPLLRPDQILLLTSEFRGFAPLVFIEDAGIILGGDPAQTTALFLQYTGFQPTFELRTFRLWNRARNLDEFREGLSFFDFGSQNWAYADKEGNLAYFSSGELPLRRDLEQGAVVGNPPWFVRDGSGPNNWISDPARSQGQSIPFAVLPFEEMPQVVNPANGFFASANNDPAGTTLDNDPLNQRRTSNPDAIYYLNPSYALGLRAGRITRLLRDKLDAGQKITVDDMKRFQANTQQLDAELMTPFLLQAFANAQRAGAPAALVALAADAGVAEAIGRLTAWDFSTPTGIPEGYDAHDGNGVRLDYISPAERAHSVAATLYNVWRAKALSIVDGTLDRLGVPGVGSGDALKALHHLLSRTPYTGIGASDVDFVPEPAGLSAEDRRDLALLQALRTALDALAGPDFEAAFAGSTNQDDYRWGRLHRITFDAELGGDFSVPPAGGFQDLAGDLPGISRDGGYSVVNASGFSARAASSNAFRFGGGPVRRYVGVGGGGASPDARISGWNVYPGGSSGDVASPTFDIQLPTWLTADYHPVEMFQGLALREALSVEEFRTPEP